MKLNYDEFTVTYGNEPSYECLCNFYNLLLDNFIDKYGEELVREAIEKINKLFRCKLCI